MSAVLRAIPFPSATKIFSQKHIILCDVVPKHMVHTPYSKRHVETRPHIHECTPSSTGPGELGMKLKLEGCG